MHIKAVIFDLDGTLANTLPLCIQAARQSIEPLIDKKLSDEEIIATFGPSEEGSIMALAPDHYEEGVTAFLDQYAKLHHTCPAIFDGMGHILDTLRSKHIPTAMVTGKGQYSTAISLKQFGLEDYFSMIETGSPEGPRKVAGISAVLAKWPDIQKEEVIYIGDAPTDITACREVGIPIVAAAWAETADPDTLTSMKPDAMFTSVEAFGKWLEERLG